MSAGVAEWLAAAHECALAGGDPPDRSVLRIVEWRIDEDGPTQHVVADLAERRARVGGPGYTADVKVEGASEAIDALLTGRGDLLSLLAAQELRLSGRAPAVDALLRLLPALARGYPPSGEAGSDLAWLADITLPSEDQFRCGDLPLDLTRDPIDQLLLVALILKSLPAAARAARRKQLLHSLPSGPSGDTALTRLLISTADLAAGNSDHLAQRAEARMGAVAVPER